MSPILAQAGQIDEEVGRIADSLQTVQVTWATGLTAFAVFVLGIILARIARRSIRELGERTGIATPDAWKFAGRAAFYLVILFGTGGALGVLGFDILPFLSTLGIVAIVVAIGLQPLMENFAAGMTLQTRRPFESGDQIGVVGVEGTVLDITSRTVLIESVSGEHVHIPNRKVLDETLTIYTAQGVRRTVLQVGLDYATDLETAAELIRTVASETDGVASDPPVTVYVHEFGDSTINAAVWLWHDSGLQDGWEITHRVAVDLKRALDAAGITIAFPQRVLTWADPPEGTAT